MYEINKRLLKESKSALTAIKAPFLIETFCHRVQIPTSGYYVEKFLADGKLKKNKENGTNVRNKKWDRAHSGKTYPSKKSLNELLDKDPGLKPYIDIPLWDALDLRINSFDRKNSFYLKLPHRIQKHLFISDKGYIDEYKRRPVNETFIRPIVRQNDVYALASVIMLYREITSQKATIDCFWLERAIRSLIWRICALIPFYFIRHSLLSYITLYICNKTDEERLFKSPWKFSYQYHERYIDHLRDTALVAYKLNMVSNPEEASEFIYWLTMFHSKEIYNELNQILLENIHISFSKTSTIGQLVKKLNTTRTKRSKLPFELPVKNIH